MSILKVKIVKNRVISLHIQVITLFIDFAKHKKTMSKIQEKYATMT